MSKLAFVDTETTGLHPDRHEVWEVGLVLLDDGLVELRTPDDSEHWAYGERGPTFGAEDFLRAFAVNPASHVLAPKAEA